jgi:general secretion pathway protein I
VSAILRRGFTLLEVMISLALLAGALMAASDLAGAALRNHEFARDLNAAVLLARGRMAELEEQYEDSGFKDFDESSEGDFSEEGRPDARWKVEVLRPSPDLSADQLVSRLAGATESTPAELASKLFGGQAPTSGGGPVATTTGNAGVAMLTKLVEGQLTTFGDLVKRSLREVRLTVSWPSGKQRKSFTIATHMVVINPRAPGGARGPYPDVPAAVASLAAGGNQAAAAAASAVVGQPDPSGAAGLGGRFRPRPGLTPGTDNAPSPAQPRPPRGGRPGPRGGFSE